MRPSARREAGFTLLEMIIALSLSSIVLVGAFTIMTSAVQNQVMLMRKGTVNAWSIASLVAMNRDIEGGSVLAYPAAGLGQNSVVVCSGYSRIVGAGGTPSTLPSLPAGVTPNVYTYCWDAATNVFRRRYQAGTACPAPPATPPACIAGNYPEVVASGVYQDPALDPIFQRDPNNASAVRVRYVVGNPNANAVSAGSNGMTVSAQVQSMSFDSRLTLENKQLSNNAD